MTWSQDLRPDALAFPSALNPLPYPLFLDTCALADPITVAAYRLGVLRDGVVLRSVAREIATLCTDSAKQEAGRQAALTVLTLHGLPQAWIAFDDEAPRAAHGDEDLLQRAAEVQGGILTADRGLQEAAHQRGVRAVTLQTLSRHLQSLADTLTGLFALSQELTTGTRLRVRIVKCGDRGAGMAYPAPGQTVVVAEGGGLVGHEVEVCIERTRRSPDGKTTLYTTLTTGTRGAMVPRNGSQSTPAGAAN